MKFLVPINASTPEWAPIEHLEAVARRGAEVEVLLLNVQPAFNQRVSRFTSRADRDAFRVERSRAAMAGVIERLARSRIPFRAAMVIGTPAQAIAEVAEAERVDDILVGERRRPQWLRWFMRSPAEEIAARTDIPVTVIASGRKEQAARRLTARPQPLGTAAAD